MKTDTATVWHEFDVPPLYVGDPTLTIRLTVGQHFHMTFPAGREVQWEVVLDGHVILSGSDLRTPAAPATHNPKKSARALASFLTADADHMYRCNRPSGCRDDCSWSRYAGTEARDLMIISDRLTNWEADLIS